MDRDLLVKNIVSTVKLARVFGLPTVHSTVNVKSGRNKPAVAATVHTEVKPVQVHRMHVGRGVYHAPPDGVADRVR